MVVEVVVGAGLGGAVMFTFYCWAGGGGRGGRITSSHYLDGLLDARGSLPCFVTSVSLRLGWLGWFGLLGFGAASPLALLLPLLVC